MKLKISQTGSTTPQTSKQIDPAACVIDSSPKPSRPLSGKEGEEEMDLTIRSSTSCNPVAPTMPFPFVV